MAKIKNSKLSRLFSLFQQYWFLLTFSLTVLFFFALRIQPLLHHTVPYTYDQGRDLLQAAHIVLDKKPTFIGPTTGIMGLFHGAWWYYVLIIPFLIFRGSPIGFYYFNCLIQFGVFLLFVWFALKYFNKSIAALIGLIIATSPYFTLTAFFIGNNMMVIPVLFVFVLLNYRIFLAKNKKQPYWLLCGLGLSLGLVAEFELSFGMFIVPLYLLGILVFSRLRTTIMQIPQLLVFSTGLLIAFSMRLLFELRHDFLQTKTIINFFIKPHLYNPKPYIDVLKDRVTLFINYYQGLSSSWLVIVLLSILVTYLVIKTIQKRTKSQALTFYIFLVIGLFLLSTLYKDTFWVNYYEGIHLIFLIILAILIHICEVTNTKKILMTILIGTLLTTGLVNSIRSLASKSNIDGLVKMEKIVDYIDKQIKNSGKSYCVKIYTPPVIPYTYDYLFLYQEIFNKIPRPQSQWVDKKCWFILERDDYAARKLKWMNDQGLDRSKRLYGTKVVDTDIGYYEIKE